MPTIQIGNISELGTWTWTRTEVVNELGWIRVDSDLDILDAEVQMNPCHVLYSIFNTYSRA